MKEDIIYLLFDNWCNSGHEPEVIEAMKKDFRERFHDESGESIHLEMSYTHDLEAANAFKEEVQAAFPGCEILMQPLSLSISCHIGPGALAIACSKKIEY